MPAINRSSFSKVILLFFTVSCSANYAVPSAFSISECFTAYATTSTKPVPTSTKSYDNTITYPVLVIERPSTTLTPPPQTSTTTTTTTTTSTSQVPQITDTFTTTTTSTITETTTLPTTTFIDYTTTTTTSTTTVNVLTVPTPAGFRPILDTLPAAQAKKRDVSVSANSPSGGSLVARAAIFARTNQISLCPIIQKGNKPLPRQYPKSVTCFVIKQVFVAKPTTKFVGPTATVTAPPSTSTVTATEEDTSVVVVTTPNASTTVTATSYTTETSTLAPSTTTTQTATATILETRGLSTAYAQCAPNSANYASGINGLGILSAYATDDSAGPAYNTPDASREACCNTCAANPGCAVSVFFGGFAAGQRCFNIAPRDAGGNGNGGRCAVQGVRLGLLVGGGLRAGEGYVASNGGCGLFDRSVVQS